jgi:hypothetical protein
MYRQKKEFLNKIFFISLENMAEKNAQIRATINAKLIESGEREQYETIL